MILFPAIDLRRGQCVRLRMGDPDAETVFGDDPAAMAQHWVQLGAAWLHIVNLDGALGEGIRTDAKVPVNVQALQAIRQAVPVSLQFGGGIRTLDDVRFILDLGVERTILGTVAVQKPSLVAEAIRQFGTERIVVGLDARNGNVATHGWQEQSGLSAITVGQRMRDMGVSLVVYTDIGRDAMLTGVNLEETVQLAQETGLQVIASGGVASLGDIQALLDLGVPRIAGVISGQALYTGRLDLQTALALIRDARAVQGKTQGA